MRRTLSLTCLVACWTSVICGCAMSNKAMRPGTLLERTGDEIVVCGQLFHTGAPVVLWTDPGGYDAYRLECRFDSERKGPKNSSRTSSPRYDSFRRGLPEEMKADVEQNGWSLEMLKQCVDQFVIHYDACGTSRRCFEVLQDLRGLSVHFMLDLDGTIYQTLDCKERAWHAGKANDRSVGIEIANIGAWEHTEVLDQWYGCDEHGRTYVKFPSGMIATGIRDDEYIPHPARSRMIDGEIQGIKLMQYDLTDEQYDSLIKLATSLSEVLPLIRADYPRDENGDLVAQVLTQEELDEYQGYLGHFHVTENKVDPGPAFDWDRLVDGVRHHLAR